jgi:hypothetical protein
MKRRLVDSILASGLSKLTQDSVQEEARETVRLTTDDLATTSQF